MSTSILSIFVVQFLGSSIIIDAGSLTLSGTNSSAGNTTLNGGILNINSGAGLGTGSTLIITGGSLNNTKGSPVTLTNNNAQNWNGNFAFGGANPLNLGTGAVTLGVSTSVNVGGSTLTVGGIIGGSGMGLSKAGAGTMVLNGANTYSGGTTVIGGTLQVGNVSALGPTNNSLAVSSGTLDLHGVSPTVGALSGNGTIASNGGGAATLTVGNGSNATYVYTGLIADNTDVGGGTVALVKTGGGSLALTTATNTYSGGTTVSGGTLLVGNNGSENVAALGTGLVTVQTGATVSLTPGGSTATFNVANSFVLDGGAISEEDGFQHIGTGVSATINVTSNGGALEGNWNNKGFYIDGQLTGSGPLAVQSAPGVQGTGTRLGITYITNDTNTYSGTLTVNGIFRYGEQLVIGANNALQYATVNLNGTPSAGSPPAPLASLRFGSTITAPVIGGLAGSGDFVLTTDTTAVAVILTVGGNNSNTTYSGSISGLGGLTKIGNGTLNLTGPNNIYSGQTTVSAGKLNITGYLSGNGAVVVNGGGSLGGNGFIFGATTVAGGATAAAQGMIDMRDDVTGTLTFSTGLTIGGSTAGNISKLAFDEGTFSDSLSVGAVTDYFVVNPGGARITIADTGMASTTYTLATFSNSSIPGNITFDSGSMTKIFGLKTATLSVSSTDIKMTVTNVAGANDAVADMYWKGAYGSTWNTTSGVNVNFTSDLAGTSNAKALPTDITNVIFAATGVTNPNTTLGQNFYIRKLTIQSGVGAVTIGGTDKLEVGVDGISVAAGDTLTLNMGAVCLLDNQTWTNSSSNPLTVANAVTGPFVLTAGGGTIVFNGDASYTGGTTVSAGTLQLGSTGSLSGGGPLVVNGGTFDLGGHNTTVAYLDDLGISGGSITNTATGTATLTAGDANYKNYSGLLTDGGVGKILALTKVGAGSLTLSGVNTYSGNTTVSAGTLQIGGPSSIGSGTLILQDASTVQSDNLSVTLANPVVVSGGGNATVSGFIDLIVNGGLTNSGGNGTLTVNNTGNTTLSNVYLSEAANTGRTLTITGTGNVSITGVVADFLGSGTAGTLAFNSANIVTLSGASTYSGGTTITGGPTINITNASAFGTGAVTFNSIATLVNTSSGSLAIANNVNLGTLNAVTIGGSNALQINGVLGNSIGIGTGSNDAVLTVNNTALTTLAGGVNLGNHMVTIGGTGNVTISGPVVDGNATYGPSDNWGRLVYSGSGTLTVTGANTNSAGLYANSGTVVINTVANSTVAVSTTTTTGLTTATVSPSATGLAVGQTIAGNSSTQPGTTITAINGTQITLSMPASNSATATLNYGTSSSIGLGTNAAANLSIADATLRYTGATGSTDRLFTISGAAASTIDASGSGPISFTGTGSVAYGTTAVARSIVLTGTNTGANSIAAIMGDNGAGAVTLTKNGTGKWSLAGSNIYTGAMTINNGVLALASTGQLATASAISTTATTATFEVDGGTHTVGNISGIGNTTIAAGSLTATSVVQGTVTLGAGATLTIAAIPGGPSAGMGISPVPEPSTWAMLMLAAMGLGMYWRRSR